MTYEYLHTANYLPQQFRRRPWRRRVCWKLQWKLLPGNVIAPGGVDPLERMYIYQSVMVGSMGSWGITPHHNKSCCPLNRRAHVGPRHRHHRLHSPRLPQLHGGQGPQEARRRSWRLGSCSQEAQWEDMAPAPRMRIPAPEVICTWSECGSEGPWLGGCERLGA